MHLAALGAILRGSEQEKPLIALVDDEGRDIAARLLTALARAMESWDHDSRGTEIEAPGPETVADLENALRSHAAPTDAQPLVSAFAVAAGRLSEEIADRSASRAS